MKGLAIFLVVFGHCIQYFNGAGFDFFGDTMFRIIYSFHMPLFALVSGYLFYPSASRRTPGGLVMKQAMSLLLPALSWSFLVSLVRLCVLAARGEFPGLGGFLPSMLADSVHGFWFLWAMFWSSLAVVTARKFFRDSMIFYAVLIAPLVFMPKGAAYVFMYPYFAAGYLCHREGIIAKLHALSSRAKILLCMAAIASWLTMLPFFGHGSYIYTTGMSPVNYADMTFSPGQIGVDVFRWAAGFAGSASVMIAVKLAGSPKILAGLGTKTLGIYIMSGYVFGHIRLGYGGYIVNFIEAVIIVSACCILTGLIGRNRTMRKFLLGGR